MENRMAAIDDIRTRTKLLMFDQYGTVVDIDRKSVV